MSDTIGKQSDATAIEVNIETEYSFEESELVTSVNLRETKPNFSGKISFCGQLNLYKKTKNTKTEQNNQTV